MLLVVILDLFFWGESFGLWVGSGFRIIFSLDGGLELSLMGLISIGSKRIIWEVEGLPSSLLGNAVDGDGDLVGDLEKDLLVSGDLVEDLCLDLDLPVDVGLGLDCLLYTSPSPRDQRGSRMPSSA